MVLLRPALCLAAALTAAALAGAHAALDDEELPERERAGAAFEGDDTSLLQLGFRLPLASGEEPREARADIPEAPFAWALFQEVLAGPPRPWSLANDTALEPPGDGVPNEAAMLKASMRSNATMSYFAPVHPSKETAPAWLWACFGEDYDINKYTGWTVHTVATPQLVPFVVPMDHPNRTDVSVVIAPGGGSTLLAWEAEGTDVAKWLNLLGISAFVLKYRVPAPAPWNRSAAVLDAQRAVSLVRHMAPALSLNPSRIGLFGASHGGWVATFTAFAAGRQYPRRDVVDDLSPRPDFLLLLYPEIDAQAFYERSESSAPTGVYQGVPLTNLADTVPIFVANGGNDRCCTVDALYSFHTSLRKRGNPTIEINVYTEVGHGFTTCYRAETGGWEAMQHEACMWMLRARRFIMWNVEDRVPADVDYWYQKVVRFDSSLLATNSSGGDMHLSRHAP